MQEINDFDAELRKHQLQYQSERPEKKLRDFSPTARLDLFNGNPVASRSFFPAKPSPMFQTYPTVATMSPLMSTNRQACLSGRPMTDGVEVLSSMRGGFLHTPCTIPTIPSMKMVEPEGPIRCKSGGNPYMTAAGRYSTVADNCPTPPYATMLKDVSLPGFSGPVDQRKRKFSACTEAEMFNSDNRICGTLWRPQRLSGNGAEFERQPMLDVTKGRKRPAYPGGNS